MRFLLAATQKPSLVKVWVCQETSSAGSLLPPVDLASIASVIRNEGHKVRILDLRLYSDPATNYKKEIFQYKPDVIVFNLSTVSSQWDYSMIKSIPYGIKKICFGTHAQSMPAEAFNYGVDYILGGDPEIGIKAICQGHVSEECDGVWTKYAYGKLSYTDNLNTLPFPALDLLSLDRYYAPYIKRGNRFTLILGSRGCPYACDYCLYPVFFGKHYRFRSSANVVDELEEDARIFNIKEFYFLDAIFNIDENRVTDICEEILHRGLNISWACNMRASFVSRKLLEIMREAGCRRIFFGVEDIDLLHEKKKGIDKESVREAFVKTRESGISTVAFFMLFPRNDISESEYARRLLRSLKILKADAFQCNVAIPFPGTTMYEKYKNSGMLSDKKEVWNLYDPQGNKTPYRVGMNLMKVRKSVYLNFIFVNPQSVISLILNLDFRSLKGLILAFLRHNLIVGKNV